MKALGISPASGCGLPITAASAMAGCSTRSDSISAGAVPNPLKLILFFLPSPVLRYPRSSTLPMSALWFQPSRTAAPVPSPRPPLPPPVATHDLRPANADLPDLARCEVPLAGLDVDHLVGGVVRQEACGVDDVQALVVDGVHVRERRRLGHAVPLNDRDTALLPKAAGEPGRGRRCAHPRPTPAPQTPLPPPPPPPPHPPHGPPHPQH